MWHSSWGWDHMIFGMAMMSLFWGAIIVLVVLLVRWLRERADPRSTTPATHETPSIF